MYDQDSVFQSGDPTPNPETATDPADLLAQIKNDRGEQKYADIPNAIKALAESQEFIPELTSKLDAKEAELEELRKELERRATVESTIESLKTARQDTEVNPPQGLDADAAKEIFESMLTKREQEAARTQHINAVTSALSEKFGDKAEELFYGKGEELGLSQAELNSLAGTSPALVMELFGGKAKGTSVDVSTGSVVIEPEPKEDSNIFSRNTGNSVLVGSTRQSLSAELDIAKKLVDKVHGDGLTMEELSDPKVYYKYFG